MQNKLMNRILAAILMINTALLGVPGVAMGGTVGTQVMLQSEAREAKVDRLQKAMVRDDVREALVALGVASEAAQERIATLTDQELLALEQQIDRLPAGGNILVVIGIVFVVLLILDLTGVTNVFTRVG
ncbi:MAG: PA2779 family protein [Gammaproteobacteria bacterium]